MSTGLKKAPKFRADKAEDITSGKIPSPVFSGYLNFREYKTAPLYDMSISDPPKKDKEWKFIVVFRVNYSSGRVVSPSLQVWEKYKKDTHYRRADLAFHNGKILKDMAKLIWRQKPKWVDDIHLVVKEKAINLLKENHSQSLNEEIERLYSPIVDFRFTERIDRYNELGLSFAERASDIGLSESATQEEFESELRKQIREIARRTEIVSCFTRLEDLKVAKPYFNTYVARAFSDISMQYPGKQGKWKDWEIPYGYGFFLSESSLLESGNLEKPMGYSLMELVDMRDRKFKDFINAESRKIALNAYPEFSDSVVNGSTNDGEVSLSSIRLPNQSE